MTTFDAVVIGAGQAGLSASYHLQRRGVRHVVLDADDEPGGAWRHRWDSLTMRNVHGVADLPGEPAPPRTNERANVAIPAYFGEYEARHDLPVARPVVVDRVESVGELLEVVAGDRRWTTKTLVNATGTWARPFVPAYPGMEKFAGEQFHTAGYPGADHLRGKRVAVVGAGASAVQFIGELAPVTDTLWITRRSPRWRSEGFDTDNGGSFEAGAGLAAVTRVAERVHQGLAPESVVSVTGLALRPQEQEARRLGAYDNPLPMFERVLPGGLRWSDGHEERVDVILWATGFRAAVDHLAPLKLRSPAGGIALLPEGGQVQASTRTARDPRINLVGYGPSASTLGASRAGGAAKEWVVRRPGENSWNAAAQPSQRTA